MSRRMTRVSSSTASRCAGSAGWTPSIIASRSPAMTVSGVRSSWLTSARSRRRWRSSAVQPLDHRVEAARQVADRSASPARACRPGRVVAGLDPRRRVDQPVQAARGPAQRPTDTRRGRAMTTMTVMIPAIGPTVETTVAATVTSVPATTRKSSANRQPKPRREAGPPGRPAHGGPCQSPDPAPTGPALRAASVPARRDRHRRPRRHGPSSRSSAKR